MGVQLDAPPNALKPIRKGCSGGGAALHFCSSIPLLGLALHLLLLLVLPPIRSFYAQSRRAWEQRGRSMNGSRRGRLVRVLAAGTEIPFSRRRLDFSLRQRRERDVGSELGQEPSCVSAERVFVPGARIPASSGAPAGLGNDGAGGGRGDRVLSGTCGICRDGIGRWLALWGPPAPVAAVVWLGGPSSRWGSARWVSAPQGPLRFPFPRAGTLGVTLWCRSGGAWRGLALGLGGGVAPAVCGQCSDPRLGVWRPKPFLAVFSCLVPFPPFPAWQSLLQCAPPPSRS